MAKAIHELELEILDLKSKLKLLETYAIPLEKLEWSGVSTGPGNGPMGSGSGGTRYSSCPCCGQLQSLNGDFIPEAVGHLNTCELAKALGVPRNPPITGTQESLSF